MNQKLNLLILIMAFLSANIAVAQYGDAYHRPNNYLIEKNQKDYTQSQIDKARNNTNSKSNTLSVDLEAAQKLINSWKKNSSSTAVKKTPEELANIAEKERKREESRKRYDEKAAIEKAESLQRLISKEQLVKPFKDKFINAGITRGEAHEITSYSMYTKDGIFSPDQEQFEILIPAYEYVVANTNSISFEDFQTQFNLLYKHLPYSTLKIIENLKARFPNKTVEIDNMQFNCLLAFYSENYSELQKEEVYEVYDIYEKLLKKHPDIEMYLFEHLKLFGGYNDPYTSTLRKNEANLNGKENRMYKKLIAKNNKIKEAINKKLNEICKTSEGILNYLEYNKTKDIKNVILIYFDFSKNKPSLYYKKMEVVVPTLRCSDEVLWELCEKGIYDAQLLWVKKNFTDSGNVEKKDKIYQMFLKQALANDYQSLQMLFNMPLWEYLFIQLALEKNESKYSDEQYSKLFLENFKFQDARFDRAINDFKANACSFSETNFNDFKSDLRKYQYYDKMGSSTVAKLLEFRKYLEALKCK